MLLAPSSSVRLSRQPVIHVLSSGRRYGRLLREGCSVLSRRCPIVPSVFRQTALTFSGNYQNNLFGSFGRSDVILRMSDVVRFRTRLERCDSIFQGLDLVWRSLSALFPRTYSKHWNITAGYMQVWCIGPTRLLWMMSWLQTILRLPCSVEMAKTEYSIPKTLTTCWPIAYSLL